MTDTPSPVNAVAPLRNVVALMGGIDRAKERPAHLPGLVVMHGKAGRGKSWAAVAAMNSFRAYYAEVRSTWTRKHLAQVILAQMGLATTGSTPALVDRIGDHMLVSGRPLIVDEADFLVQRGMIEIIRDIYEQSSAPVVLIGEEHLPEKLERWERVHSRVLEWITAEAADLADARALVGLYCAKVRVGDDLLEHVVRASDGSVRRICVNLDRIREAALAEAPEQASRAWWGDRALYTGQPARRV
jgi:hypothetical protein